MQEAGVKKTRFRWYKHLNKKQLTFEELYTFFKTSTFLIMMKEGF